MSKPTPLPGLLEIDPYKPGKATAKADRIFKLSSNENALGPSPKAIEAFQQAGATLEKYPDPMAMILREAISEVHQLPADNLAIGAGSDEIIQLLIKAYAQPGDNIVQTRHGFSYYWIAAQGSGVATKFADEVNLALDVDNILATVDEGTRIVFIANPNNPTGTMVGKERIRELRERLPDNIMLVLDGAYAEYVSDPEFSDGADFVQQSIEAGTDNVVMMRTFSKVYGLAGLRIGWAFAPKEIVDVLNRVRGPFNVGAAPMKAAAAAMLDQEYVATCRAHNDLEGARMASALSALGFDVVDSPANFRTFSFNDGDEAKKIEQAKALMAHLEEQGVIVRSAASGNLPAHIRVTIGTAEANDAFLAGVKSFVAS